MIGAFQLLCWFLAAISALVGCSGSPLSERNSTNTPQSDFIEAFQLGSAHMTLTLSTHGHSILRGWYW
jgi:hypothetical protein